MDFKPPYYRIMASSSPIDSIVDAGNHFLISHGDHFGEIKISKTGAVYLNLDFMAAASKGDIQPQELTLLIQHTHLVGALVDGFTVFHDNARYTLPREDGERLETGFIYAAPLPPNITELPKFKPFDNAPKTSDFGANINDDRFYAPIDDPQLLNEIS